MCGVIAISLASPALANPAVGQWLTQADGKGQTAIVTSKPCGVSVCGTITQVRDPSGRKISHPNVGRRVFWDMKRTKSGQYEGRAYVPLLRKDVAASMTVTGNNMRVRGCAGPVCRSQVWTRVK